MKRLLRAWLLVVCASAAAQVLVREPATRARLVDGKTTVLLALSNRTQKPLEARIELEWLGPGDELHGAQRSTVTLAPGDSAVDVPLPLSEKHDPLLDRLRFQLHPGEKNYTAFPPHMGILDLVNIADYAFTLGVLTAELPRPGQPYEIRVLAAHPVSGEPAAGVQMECGAVKAVSDSNGAAVLRVHVDAEEENPEFTIVARKGDFIQTARTTPLALRRGNLRIDTDKPLYQPGQTMHVRMLETGSDGRARARAEHQVRILNEDDETVHAATTTTSRFGVASTDWEIPANARSGRHRIEVWTGQFDVPIWRDVHVRRYELPSFRVTVQPDRPYYLPRQKAVVEVRGDYLFGKPVANGTVRLVEGEDDEEPVLEGPLDASGRFRGSIDTGGEPDADIRFIDRNFTAFLTDASTNRTEQRKFDLRVSRDPLHVYVPDAQRLPASRRLYVTTYSPEGAPAVCDIEVAADGKVLGRGRTNRFGLARIDLPVGGDNELLVRAIAADGRRAQEKAVFDERPPELWLETDRTLYRPGETVRCRVAAERKDAHVLLLAWNESGEFVLSRNLRLKDGRAELDIPYEKRFGRRLSVGIASGATSATAARTVIFPGAADLELRVSPGKQTYRPGETARIEFRASAEAALGIAIVDQSVFERATTDQAFRSRHWFDPETGSGAGIGGLTESDLLNLDPAKIDADLQLVAEVLGPAPFLVNNAVDFEPERRERHIQAAQKAFAPVAKTLDEYYLNTLDYPRDELALQAVLSRVGQGLQDPWMRPYYARFTTERSQHVLQFCSDGADQRQNTRDDFCPLIIQHGWFTPLEAVIRDRLRALTDYPATQEEFTRALEEGGIRFGALRDPWDSGMRIEIGHWQDRRQIGILSAGPDRSFGTSDDFPVAHFEGRYFAAMETKIGQAVNAAREFPRTEEAFRALLRAAGLDFDVLRDPWGHGYYFKFRSEQSFTDRVQIYSYAEYNRAAEERKQITPVKRTVLFAEIRSVGEDGIPDTFDDFLVAGFSRPLDELESKPEEGEKTPPAASSVGGTGTIAGVVVDATGAIIPAVEVTLNRAYRTRADEKGSYYFRGLSPGMYRLDFQSPGFRLSVVDRVPVRPDHLTRVDTVLEVGAMSETVEVMAPMMKMVSTESAAVASVVGSSATTATPRVREYFPETLYWQPELVTDGTGRASIDVKLADSITTWRVAVIGSTEDGRITEAGADIREFQPFLVDLDVPPVLTAGDEIALPVPVRNYLERAQRVALTAAPSKGLSLQRPVRQPGQIEPSASANAVVALRADAPAENARLRVTALAGEASDAVEKSVSIHPDGERREHSVNGVAAEGKLLRLDVPASALPGSVQAEVKFFPSPLARVLASMEALLRRPYGCGEQIVSSAYPNLLFLRALKDAGVREERIEARALKYLRTGHQRLLGYQDESGGFTYWGRGEPSVALTAYALEFLHEAKEFIPVGEDRVAKAGSWLAAQASPDSAVRALQARALARLGAADPAALDRRLGEMARQAQVDDPYPIAAFALAAMDAGKFELARPAVEHLRAMAQGEQGAAFWRVTANTPFHGWGRAGQVETTALALSALVRWRKAGNTDAALDMLIERGALFLTQNADATGAWRSTQATVRALTALLEIWAHAEERNPTPAQVLVNSESAGRVTIPGARTIHGPLTLDISRFVRPGMTNEISIAGTGSHAVQAQINAVWYEPWDQPRPSSKEFSLEVRYSNQRAAIHDPVTCEVRISRPAFRGYGMMIAEIGLPPGAEVDRGTLASIVEDRASGVDSFEVAPDRVTFYVWPRAADSKFRFIFRPRFAMRARAEQSLLYDYYNPDARVALAPQTFTVE